MPKSASDERTKIRIAWTTARVGLAALLLLGGVLGGDASAEPQIIMQLNGIKGSVLVAGFEDSIPVTGFATAIVASSKIGKGGLTPGKPDFRPVEVTKPVDEADSGLFDRAAKGLVISDGCLLTFDTGESGLRLISAIGLSGLLVESLSPSFTVGGFPQQSVSLNYTKISMITYLYDEQGTSTGFAASCFDRGAGVPCGMDLLSCPASAPQQ